MKALILAVALVAAAAVPTGASAANYQTDALQGQVRNVIESRPTPAERKAANVAMQNMQSYGAGVRESQNSTKSLTRAKALIGTRADSQR